MKAHRLILGIACSGLLSAGFSFAAVEITQEKSGKSLTVEPQSIANGKVKFSMNGKEFTLPLDQLTQESQERLMEWKKTSTKADLAVPAERLNEVIGQELFASDGTALWDEPIASVGKRLKWREESTNEVSSSYRSYPKPDYGFINAHPYCCTLYGKEEGKVAHFSLVYANKGDFGSTVGSGEDHFQPQGELPTANTLNEAITRDATAINLALTELLGEAVEQRYGEKEDRRKVKRWNYGKHAFILSEREGEYAHLLIVPKETADNEGKTKFVIDREFRGLLAQNVVQQENGDIRIKNIPMVNQGPKGYCAPATFERAMRYMQVPADMYLLATIATSPGGGTSTRALADEAKRIIRSKARRIKELELSEDLSIRTVSTYIDKGVPILWQMASLKKYNDIANKRTKEREGIEDFDGWATEIAEEAEKVVPSLVPDSNYHICMIVGYNEATNELAVSDSWGPRYELRWVHLDIAKAVRTAGGFVVDL